MDKSVFFDNQGIGWHVYITVQAVYRVKKHVQLDGSPLDLFYIAETGDFTAVSKHIEAVVQAVYWILYPEIKEYSGKDGIEAQEWFYSRLDGESIPALITAWEEGIINFTPSLAVREAMKTAQGMRIQAEIVATIQHLVGQLETSTDMLELPELIPEDSLMGN